MPELQGPILEAVQQLVSDELSGPVSFRLAGGAGVVDLNVAYQLYDANESSNSHLMPALLDQNAALTLGLTSQNTLFHREFLRELLTLMPSNAHQGLAEAVLGMFRIHDELPNDGRPEDYIRADIGAKRFFTLKSSMVSSQVVSNYQIVTLLRGFSQEQIQKLIETEKLDELTDEEKLAKSLGNEILQKFLDGGFQSPAFYAMIVESLAKLSP